MVALKQCPCSNTLLESDLAPSAPVNTLHGETYATFSRGTGTKDFYYDGWRVMEEHDGSDAILRQYTYGNYLDEVWTLDDRRGGITVANLNSSGSEIGRAHV